MIFSLTLHIEDKPDMQELLDKYSVELMRLCFLYLNDYHLAEDAVQDTLLKAYKKYGTFKGQSSIKTWVISIAINVCKNYMRRKSYSELKSSIASFSIGNNSSTEESIINTEENINLLNAVYSLPTIYKEVILLHYYKQLKISQIAKILNKNSSTVGVRLKRAREMLKDYYEEDIL